jgi:MFS family permease
VSEKKKTKLSNEQFAGYWHPSYWHTPYLRFLPVCRVTFWSTKGFDTDRDMVVNRYSLTGATTGLVTLIGTRFLFGMGEAGAFPTSSGVISHWFPANETSRGLSSVLLVLNVGAAIAPLIVIPIAVAYGWRAPFLLMDCLGYHGYLSAIYGSGIILPK